MRMHLHGSACRRRQLRVASGLRRRLLQEWPAGLRRRMLPRGLRMLRRGHLLPRQPSRRGQALLHMQRKDRDCHEQLRLPQRLQRLPGRPVRAKLRQPDCAPDMHLFGSAQEHRLPPKQHLLELHNRRRPGRMRCGPRAGAHVLRARFAGWRCGTLLLHSVCRPAEGRLGMLRLFCKHGQVPRQLQRGLTCSLLTKLNQANSISIRGIRSL